jgi:hypothetical protein
VNDSTTPNVTEPASQPLELTAGVWIVLGLVALLGISHIVHVDDEVRTLLPWDKNQLVIVRQVVEPHSFSFLGIKVLPVSGWTYLSITDDSLADRPTFVNQSTHSILSLRLMKFGSWPPSESEVTREEYGDVTIEWIEVVDRRWGRITKESPGSDAHVTVIVMTHVPRSELNASVRDFCRAIGWLDSE